MLIQDYSDVIISRTGTRHDVVCNLRWNVNDRTQAAVWAVQNRVIRRDWKL